MMNSKEIIRNEKFHVFIFTMASFLLHVVVIYKFSGWFSTDTDGYWLHAATFLGKDWSGVARNMNYYYSWGYSLLLTIPMLLTDIPTRMIKISIILNSLLCAAVVPMAYYILRKITHNIRHMEAVICAFVVSVYSTYVMEAGVSLSECFIYFMCFFVFVSFIHYTESEKRCWGMLLGFSAGFLYIIHNRNIGILVAFVVSIAIFFLVKKDIKRILSVILPFAVSVFLKVYVDNWLRIKETTENVYTKNTYASMLDKYTQHRSFYRVISIFENVIGEYWYTCIGTLIIGCVGVWYLCRKIIQYKKNKIEFSKFILYLYALLSWLFSVGVSAVAIAKAYFEPNGRIDILIYGRYMECTVGILMLFGFVCIQKIRKEIFTKNKISYFVPMLVSVVVVSVITYFVSLHSDPYKCNWFSVVAILFPFHRDDMKVSILTASILLGIFGILVLFCLLRDKKHYNLMGYILMVIMFLYIGYNTTEQVSQMYAEGKSIVNNPIYNESFSDICEYINDNDLEKLYVFSEDGYEAFSYQFMNPEIVVIGITGKEDLDSVSPDSFVLMKSAEIPNDIVYEVVYSNDLYSLCHINGGFYMEYAKNYSLELDTLTVDLPTVDKNYDLLFFSDNQANFDTREDLGWFGSSQNRVFVDENGTSAAQNFDHFINFANESGVDGVLLGGDIIDFASDRNLEVLKDKMQQLEAPYIYTYGNHDSYVPWENRFDDDNEQFLNLFSNDNDCEFQRMDLEGVTIVSVRNYQKDGTANISADALRKFKDVYEDRTPIILMVHVPIYTEYAQGLVETTSSGKQDMYRTYDAGTFGTVFQSRFMGYDCGYHVSEETREFLDLVLAEDSPVCFVLAGHLHEGWNGNISESTREYIVDGAFKNKGVILKIR